MIYIEDWVRNESFDNSFDESFAIGVTHPDIYLPKTIHSIRGNASFSDAFDNSFTNTEIIIEI